MSTGKPAKSNPRKKKLTLNKQTLKDLAPGKSRGQNVRGGAIGACTDVNTGCRAGGGGMGGASGGC